MPYIKQKDRKKFDKYLIHVIPSNKGELNYCVTRLAVEFLANNKKSYQTISDAVNALKDAAGELERRVLHPYENLKIEENGDIPPYRYKQKKDEEHHANISPVS
jgi:hypothetical protein